MEIRLLGPVEVCTGGRGVAAGPPQQRTVLAALAVDVPRPVPVDTLLDRVWGQRPPGQPQQAVWTRVAGIRKLLAGAAAVEAARAGDEPTAGAGPGGGSGARRAGDRWVAWGPNGYLLRVEADQVDLLRFRRLAAAARRGECSDAERVGLLEEALGLWRGVALAGLSGEWASRQREGWRLERLEATLEWGRAALRLDQPARVVPVARDLAEQHPHNEALAVVLGWALAADGRRDEAAAHCKTVCDRLATDLGTGPGSDLRRLQQAVLNDRPLPPLRPPPAPPATPPAVPAQLPGDVPGFAGRSEHLARLDALLATAAADAPTAVVISAVSGTAGVGKTALAVHWAHRAAHQFPDGQLYVNLRGFHPGGQVIAPAAAVRGFIDAFGVPPERVPADPDAQTALYRSLLAGKKMLVVLDNARDAEQARPLLPGTPAALAVVTSRNQLSGLVAADGAHPLTLDLLTHDEARELLERRLGRGRVAAEPEAVERIIGACARLPLALAIAAARAAQTGFPLTVLAGELADAGGRLGVLDAGEAATRVRAVFSWSYTTLTPPAARLFRLLGLHPGPDVSAAAAASLTALPRTEAGRLLAELTRASLTTEHLPGRYSLHDLLAAYAAELSHTTDPDHDRRAATIRLLDHYTHTAHTADRLLYPARDPILLPLTPPAPGATPEQPAGDREALAWLTAEQPVLLAAQRLAATTGLDTHTWQLAWALTTLLDRRGHWQDEAGAWQAAAAAADRLTHPTAAAYAHRHLARAGTLLGRYGEAHTHLRRALDLHTRAGDRAGQAHTHIALALLWERQDRPGQALGHARQALTLYQATGHRRGQAIALNNAGWCHALLGDHTQALTYCQQALTLFQQAGDRDGEAGTWDSLGYTHHHLNQHTQAAGCYQHALTLFRDLGDRYQEADTLTHLGDTHHTAGDPDAARAAWTHALDILTDLHHPDADTVHAKLHDLDQTMPGGEAGPNGVNDEDGTTGVR
jgi:DNA-binding SARP family transcriptional activator/tetratricopeptide (TPR) repeat protein